MVDQTTEAAAGEATVEPIEVIVEKIEAAVDPNDAVMDEDGRVTRWFDRENNKTFVVKGHETKIDTTDSTDSGSTSDDDQDADNSNDDDQTGDGQTTEGESDEDEVEYLNPADRILKFTGYKGETVNLGEGEIKIEDLTVDQQLEIVETEFDLAIQERDERIAELEARAPELVFEDPTANEIVKYLKEGGDLQQLAKEIISRDPAAQAKILTDDEVNKLAIKKQFPDYTDKEVDEELGEMSPAAKARRAKAFRSQMEKEKPSFADLTEKQKEANAQEVLKQQEAWKVEVNKVKEAAKALKTIGGVPVDDKVRDYLISQVVPAKMEEESAFVSAIQQNPAKLAELKFWDQYGAKLLKDTAKVYFERGLREGNKGKEVFSDEPVRTYKSRATQQKQMKSIEDVDDISGWIDNAEF